jgi:hypothetical protein
MNTGVRSRTPDESSYDSVAATKSRTFKWNNTNCFLYLNDGNEVVIVAESRAFVIEVGNLYQDSIGWNIRFDEEWDVAKNYDIYLKLKDWLGIDAREKPLTQRQEALQGYFVDEETAKRLALPDYNPELERRRKDYQQTVRNIEKKYGIDTSPNWGCPDKASIKSYVKRKAAKKQLRREENLGKLGVKLK